MYVSYVKSLFSVFQASQRPETRFYLFVKKSLKAVHFNIKVQTGVLSWVLVFFCFFKVLLLPEKTNYSLSSLSCCGLDAIFLHRNRACSSFWGKWCAEEHLLCIKVYLTNFTSSISMQFFCVRSKFKYHFADYCARYLYWMLYGMRKVCTRLVRCSLISSGKKKKKRDFFWSNSGSR